MKRILVILILTMLGLLSCGSPAGNKEKKNSGEVRKKKLAINIQGDPKSIDPQLAAEASGIIVDTLLVEGLTRIDLEGNCSCSCS